MENVRDAHVQSGMNVATKHSYQSKLKVQRHVAFTRNDIQTVGGFPGQGIYIASTNPFYLALPKG